jgi:hypothetical protein
MYILFLAPQESFNRAKSWVLELQRQASPNIVIALAGNKADITAREVDSAEAEVRVFCESNMPQCRICRLQLLTYAAFGGSAGFIGVERRHGRCPFSLIYSLPYH